MREPHHAPKRGHALGDLNIVFGGYVGIDAGGGKIIYLSQSEPDPSLTNGRCIYCDLIQQEFDDENRIVAQNEQYLAFCPFVPRYPFETWIMPKEHPSRFCSMSKEERWPFAAILKEVLQRIKICLGDPSYNFYLHVSPFNYEKQESYHWHIEIIPQLTRVAGFEWGTGLYVVRTCPSVAAGHLRGVVLGDKKG